MVVQMTRVASEISNSPEEGLMMIHSPRNSTIPSRMRTRTLLGRKMQTKRIKNFRTKILFRIHLRKRNRRSKKGVDTRTDIPRTIIDRILQETEVVFGRRNSFLLIDHHFLVQNMIDLDLIGVGEGVFMAEGVVVVTNFIVVVIVIDSMVKKKMVMVINSLMIILVEICPVKIFLLQTCRAMIFLLQICHVMTIPLQTCRVRGGDGVLQINSGKIFTLNLLQWLIMNINLLDL